MQKDITKNTRILVGKILVDYLTCFRLKKICQKTQQV